MSNIGDAMGRLFGGEQGGFQDQLRGLIAQHRTVSATARALGVDRRTIQRWQSGAIRTPKPATTQRVGREYRRGVADRRGLPGDREVKVGFTQRKKSGGLRDREVTGEKLGLADGTMAGAKQAFVDSGPEAAAAAFVAGIGDDWYHDLFENDLTGEGAGADETASDPAPTGVSVS